MTLAEREELSHYEEVFCMDENVWFVLNEEKRYGYEKRYLSPFCEPVYKRLASVHDCGIPRIYLSVQDEGHLTVIEDFILGKTLERYLDEYSFFPVFEICFIMLQLCCTLEKLHNMNPPLTHRDICTSNIMYNTERVVKLVNFRGIERASAAYDQDMCQEQNDSAQSGIRADIYGIGATIQELMSRRYSRDSDFAIGALRQIVQRCTGISKHGQYSSVTEVAYDLEVVMCMGQPKWYKKLVHDFVSVGSRKKVWWKKRMENKNEEGNFVRIYRVFSGEEPLSPWFCR